MPKSKSDQRRTLADNWSPPVIAEIGEIGHPLICVASTYTFHAPFFESELLPRFLGLKFDETEGVRPFVVEREQALASTSVCLLVDADHFDPAQTTLRWDQLSVRVPLGAQHSKVVILLWEHCVRLIVASANITRPGYRKNREIAGIVDFYDHENSPPRKLLLDAIGFIHAATGFVRASDAAKDRLQRALRDIRTRVRSWRRMPTDFRPLARPRVTFVGGLPDQRGRVSQSPLGRLVELWGTRRASEVTVMTPFVAELSHSIKSVVEKLLEIPIARDAIGCLVVPGRASEIRERMVVGIPRTYLESWCSSWGSTADQVRTYVVPLCRDGEPLANRDLHAKGILLEGDGAAMLLCGSSNFSQHGMGVGVANVEANLCYLDDPDVKRDRLRLHERLPVDWEKDLCESPIWPETADQIEDERHGTDRPLPAAFLWGIYDQVTAVLAVVVDPSSSFPRKWFLHWPGERQSDAAPLAQHTQFPFPPSSGRIILELPASLRGANIAGLRLEWRDDDGIVKSAVLPVYIESGEHLRPPEEFRLLSADGILECLLSGREPAELVDKLDHLDGSTPQKGNMRELDSLRAVDTSSYLIYRTRRFGAALSSMGERLLRTVQTREAFGYRLRQDPIGPRMLTEALVREWKENAADAATLLFNLSEIKLVLAHVARRIGDKQLAPLLRKTAEEIDGHCAQVSAGFTPPPNLALYLESVRAESSRLLQTA